VKGQEYRTVEGTNHPSTVNADLRSHQSMRAEMTVLADGSTVLLQQLNDNSRTTGSHHFRSDIPPALEEASEELRMGFSWPGGDPMCDLALPLVCPRLGNQPEAAAKATSAAQNAELQRILTSTTCIYITDVDDD
jgi:hypothetical protein